MTDFGEDNIFLWRDSFAWGDRLWLMMRNSKHLIATAAGGMNGGQVLFLRTVALILLVIITSQIPMNERAAFP